MFAEGEEFLPELQMVLQISQEMTRFAVLCNDASEESLLVTILTSCCLLQTACHWQGDFPTKSSSRDLASWMLRFAMPFAVSSS